MQDLAAAVAPFATKRVFKKHSVLLYQGEVPRMAYVLQSGLVKMYGINNAGEEQIVAFHEPGDAFPGPWLFNKAPTTLHYYETLTNCTVLTLMRETLYDTMHKPEFLQYTLDYFVANYTGLIMRVTALEQSRAREKIMFTLYYLLFRYGRKVDATHYAIRLPLTHKLLANLVGLTRETISNEVNKLKRQKVLQYKEHTYVVHRQKLEHMLGEDSFQGFTL